MQQSTSIIIYWSFLAVHMNMALLISIFTQLVYFYCFLYMRLHSAAGKNFTSTTCLKMIQMDMFYTRGNVMYKCNLFFYVL